MIEYLTPILKVKKKLDAIKTHFRSTLVKYYPKEEIDQIEVGSDDEDNDLRDKMESMAFKVNIGDPKSTDLSLRRYQAVRSYNLMDEKPEMLEYYLELVVQFGYIVLFSEVFPLAAFLSLLSNGIQIRSQIHNLKYVRRFGAEVSNGIGSWMTCLQTLSQISIYLNCATVFFTSQVYYKLFVEGDDEISAITVGWDSTKFLLMVVIVEHTLLILKILIEQSVEDTPYFVVRGLRERQALINNFLKIKEAGSKPEETKKKAEADGLLRAMKVQAKNGSIMQRMKDLKEKGKRNKQRIVLPELESTQALKGNVSEII